MPDFAGSYPGLPGQVRHVRYGLAQALNGCPVADESVLAAIAGDGNWGIDGDSDSGRTVWVRLDWPGPQAASMPRMSRAVQDGRVGDLA